MQARPGDNLVDMLGIELPPWTLLAGAGIVGLIILRIALKPKAALVRTAAPRR